jgi:SLT domain-containing protein
MAGRLSFLVGLGTGYVLGARSGRERYDQIAAKARRVWRDPRVQEKAGQAQQVVQEKAGQAGQVVKERVANASSSDTAKASESRAAAAAARGSGAPSARGGKRS